MKNEPDRPPNDQELLNLNRRAMLDFLNAARDLPITDDPDCPANLPGYPNGQLEFMDYTYRCSVFCREDFWEQATSESSIEEDEDSETSFAELWFDQLFELLLKRWGWWDYLARYPICYPSSVIEITERYRELDQADTPEHSQRSQELHILQLYILFDDEDLLKNEKRVALEKKYENDPALIIDDWLLNFDFPQANLTKAEFEALSRIRSGLFGSEVEISRDQSEPSEHATKQSRKRNQGKANQARGIFIAHIELIRSGKTDQPLPGVGEIAKQINCSKATVSRATKRLRDEYEKLVRIRPLKGTRGQDRTLDAWDKDWDEDRDEE